MQMGLNEMLLWHGTSKKAAETIAEDRAPDLRAARRMEVVRRGRRDERRMERRLEMRVERRPF